MRTYPTNSPEAAARIVALALLADGHLSLIEIDALERHHVAARVGLTPEGLRTVLHDLCSDLLVQAPMAWHDATQIDPRLLRDLFAEVDDPALCAELLQLCRTVIEADRHVTDGEALMLSRAFVHWRGALGTAHPAARAG